MESSTVMMQASPCFYYSSSKKNSTIDFRKNGSCCFYGSRRKLEIGFFDKAQMDYYSSSSSSKLVIKGKGKEEKMKKEKMMKKREKLLKGLSKDLSALSQMMTMGFDLDSELGGDQVKSNTVSEAAKLLLGHLEKLRAEEKEMKIKKKEEKAMSKTCKQCEDDMSSSSSSESSDSECEEQQPVNMDLLKRGESTANQPDVRVETSSAIEPLLQPHPLASLPIVRPGISTDVVSNLNGSQTSNCCKQTTHACLDEGNKPAVGISEKKIEVCMGGKCKKSGATTLLEEFQKAVGVDIPVMGCKCMGKCREGPNVRVVNNSNAQDSARTLSTPLCIGVGLEDVNLIVSNFLGENQKEVGLATAL